MKPAKLGSLLGFSLFCLLSPPVLSGVERLAEHLCKEYNDPCVLKVDPGSCYEVHFRFFYNQTAKDCQVFLYGGCNGNLNNFKLKIECQVACHEIYKKPPPPPSRKRKRSLRELATKNLAMDLRLTTLQPGRLKQTERKETSLQRAWRESRRYPLARLRT
ncbi:kunitz-type protease inhibitor 4-like [Grammomys surdaster]|uniref:kunitz-type protease inhibitor 4-like n=1 Tax=Grammomys surdaster TaxID=491861 RepID=UPI00109FE4F5|nr:kunitz-type protease inhibitor 4-like [Grammomys surdaster]